MAGRGAPAARRPARSGTIHGVYVPSLYDVAYDARHRRGDAPRPECPAVVDKRTVADLDERPYPKRQLVPLIEVVHDRLNVEIFRGCTAAAGSARRG